MAKAYKLNETQMAVVELTEREEQVLRRAGTCSMVKPVVRIQGEAKTGVTCSSETWQAYKARRAPITLDLLDGDAVRVFSTRLSNKATDLLERLSAQLAMRANGKRVIPSRLAEELAEMCRQPIVSDDLEDWLEERAD